MAFDFKREYKDLYAPKTKPSVIDVPAMSFIAVAGKGNPNEENGSYAEALALLYSLSFAIKMSKMGPWQPDGYFDYVVPPLEGLWWSSDAAFDGTSITDKSGLSWISMIRQPDFVTHEVLNWACEQTAVKKPELTKALGSKRACLIRFSEGPCVQAMHRGPYDNEPETIASMKALMEAEGLVEDIAPCVDAAGTALPGNTVLGALNTDDRIPAIRLHHEIYLGDPRRTKPENLKTIVRHPVCRNV